MVPCFLHVFDSGPPKAGIPVLHDVRPTRSRLLCDRRFSIDVTAQKYRSVSPIKRHRKVKMNIFTFRWYLVFFNFLIRGSAAKIATVTNAHWTHHCVSNAHWTPLIDDMPRIPSRSGQDMPSDPLIHGIITNICDIIIYKRGSVSVPHTIKGNPA